MVVISSVDCCGDSCEAKTNDDGGPRVENFDTLGSRGTHLRKSASPISLNDVHERLLSSNSVTALHHATDCPGRSDGLVVAHTFPTELSGLRSVVLATFAV